MGRIIGRLDLKILQLDKLSNASLLRFVILQQTTRISHIRAEHIIHLGVGPLILHIVILISI